MPSTFAHYHFGNLVLTGLEPSLQEKVTYRKSLFYIGLHGPDILFHFRPVIPNRICSKGHDMHRESAYPFFRRCRRLVARSVDPAGARAYVLGFICHFALDSTCHGYINRQVEDSGVSHAEIETEFDKYLMRQQGLDPMEYDSVTHLYSDRHVGEVIAPFFHIKPEYAAEAVKSMRGNLTMFRKVRGVARGALLWLFRAIGKYDAFAGMFVTSQDNPKCEESSLVLDGKLKEAIPVARMLIEAYLEYEEKGTPLPKRFDQDYE